ncbi:leucine-, glutamate- and lysine-rich protein 1-like [Patiria miniata]|uniref:Leucine-, glutamate- and lysine-rich protein 1 n=1 Tax=Patiria miniata TaxID=46514 RepID=A0A914BNM2_PATMI|nr:leucine-, glutamate- and lysine-rich protein 1-like [Patiria miniata]XP_038077735.1 leucine-, glutamate- and lysine-rich protein 1-like [Patiria miniata]
MKNEDEKVIERLPLEHPLPEEIQKMEKDETVCQFCGVSYLIHREVKALEDQLEKVREELARYEGSEEREQKLKDELEKTRKEKDAAIFTTQERDKSIQGLMEEVDHKNTELKELAESKKTLQSRLEEEEETSEKLRKQQEFWKTRLPSVNSAVQQQRSELQNIHTFIHQMGKIVTESSNKLRHTVQTVCSQEANVIVRLKDEVSRLEEERTSWQNGQGGMERNLRNARAEVERLTQVEGQLKQKEQKCLQLTSQIERLETELNEATTKQRTLSTEAAELRGLLKSKTQEVEDQQTQQRRKEQISEQLSSKLQHELKQKSSELQSALADYRRLEQRVRDKERAEEEIQRQATLSMGETDQIRQALMRSQEECNALKTERELMISSHQNRIEQLRESFKQKLIDAERWPSKMDDTLQKERTRHAQEMQEMEAKMKEAFRIELDIEKQRHQELTDKYKVEFQEKENKFKAELRSLSSRHKSELSQLEKQVSSLKTQASTGEESLRREVQGLKAVIGDLENRLGKAGSESDELVASLKAELREAEQDLMSSRDESRVIEDTLAQSKEEILFLQETVRRECEERFELTESLSEAREQLLAYQRHGTLAGTLTGTPRPASSTKSHKSDSSFGATRKSSTGSMPPGQGQKHGAGQAPASPNKIASSSINIGFNAGQAKPPASRPRDGSMSDSRQRIAAAIGRR